MILATVTGPTAWIIAGAGVLLCALFVWASIDYQRICAEDAERTRERESAEVVPAFDFPLARRPVASTKCPRVVRATEGSDPRRRTP